MSQYSPRHDGPRSSPANGSVRKELPENLSQEALRREAVFVLAQADKIDRSRTNGTVSTSVTDPLDAARFNSLPSRSKSRTKKVARSSSDAASKKPAKSLLNLFGRKASPDEGNASDRTMAMRHAYQPEHRTPKSSPSSAKRSLSFKSSKLSAATAADGQKQTSARSDWFKSFDRLSRKKSASKPNLGPDGKTTPAAPPPKQAKSLRFFGDTDTEYGDQSATSYRSARSNLSKTEKKYRSAYDLDTAPKMRDTARNRSSSLHNLDEEDELSLRGKDYRSVEQSSTFYRARSPSPSDYRQERIATRDYTPERAARKAYHHHRSRENGIDLVDAERSETPSTHQRPGSRSRSEHKKPPSGPQKPARVFERRDSLNR
uniref:Uncharacterized protein n=1 Tax=Anopheles farauti TaxID=69004 RepID=A0A182QYY8_9DIPT